jgi:hypothetical protein
MMTQYIIEYEGQSVIELIKKINELNGLALSELKVMDLVFDRVTGNPIRTGNGVYIFKNSIQTFYIGNCVARNFVERIPAHFDIRHNGWFNSLLKAIIKNNKIEKKQMDSNEFNSHF